MEKSSYAPGEFCWNELATTDWKSALSFYRALFGWTANEIPMADQPPYVMLQKHGKNVCALYENKANPGWLSYVAVAVADTAAKKAKSLGAKLQSEPFDVMDAGRMANITDPQNARFAIWEARRHKGADVINEIGAVCWNELYTEDIEGSREFYAGLFGWKYKVSPEYTEVHLNTTGIGGMFQITEEMRGTHPMWIPYFMVSDTDATANKVKASGGAVYVGPGDVPNVGRFAIVADPQGAAFAIIRLQG